MLRFPKTSAVSDVAMATMPELTWILALLGFFLAVFLISNGMARGGGYRE